MFSRNTPQNTKHSLYTFQSSCEFHVLLMPWKTKPQNSSTSRTNADPGPKCKKRKKGHKIPRYTLFVFRISRMFLWNTPRNTKHSLHTFRISCEFHVSLMPRKNKPRNPLTFRTNADPYAKYCKMRKKEHKIPCFALFIFHDCFCVLCDKCIVGLRRQGQNTRG